MYNNKTIKDYTLRDKIGVGSYGTVYKASKKGDKQFYVIKTISIYNMSDKEREETENEANILASIYSSYVVKYYESFVHDTDLYIVMEYCDAGDLSKFLNLAIKTGRTVPEDKVWKYFIQICLGLSSIHNKKVLHRDMKTMNIFMMKDDRVKIGDLGVAKALSFTDHAKTFIGTPYYLSPEICEEKPYNEKSDVWAIGCILYELTTYKHPFNAVNQPALILKILGSKYEPISKEYSTDLRKILDLLLIKNAHKRPSIFDILSHTIIVNKAKEIGYWDDIQRELQTHNYNMKISLEKLRLLPRNSNVSDKNSPQSNINEEVPAFNLSNDNKKSKDLKGAVNISPGNKVASKVMGNDILKKKVAYDPKRPVKSAVKKKANIMPYSNNKGGGIESKDIKKLFIQPSKVNKTDIKQNEGGKRPQTAINNNHGSKLIENDPDSYNDWKEGDSYMYNEDSEQYDNLLNDLLKMNDGLKITQDLALFGKSKNSGSGSFLNKQTINEFLKQNLKEIEKNLDVLSVIPEDKLNKEKFEQKKELLQSKSDFKELLLCYDKSFSKLKNKSAMLSDKNLPKKNSSSSNLSFVDKKHSSKNIKQVVGNAQPFVIDLKKTKSELNKNSNQSTLFNSLEYDKKKLFSKKEEDDSNNKTVILPIFEKIDDENNEYSIIENSVNTNRNHKINANNKVSDVTITYRQGQAEDQVCEDNDNEFGEEEEFYDDDENVKEISINNNDDLFKDHVFHNDDMNNDEETDEIMIQANINKWTALKEENMKKLISIIGTDVFSNLTEFYGDVTKNCHNHSTNDEEENLQVIAGEIDRYVKENSEASQYWIQYFSLDILIEKEQIKLLNLGIDINR